MSHIDNFQIGDSVEILKNDGTIIKGIIFNRTAITNSNEPRPESKINILSIGESKENAKTVVISDIKEIKHL